MKKADIVLGILFWTIVGLMIFVPTALFASKLFNLSSKGLESSNKLAEIIASLKDGDQLSSPVYMEQKSFIVGFAKNSNRFENHRFRYSGVQPTDVVVVFDKPEKCAGKSCLCFCNTMDLNQKQQPILILCNKEPICTPFNNIDFLPEKIIRKDENGKTRVLFKGGFMFIRGFEIEALNPSQAATLTAYVERYKDIVDVCAERPCITSEIKQRIDSG
ncbi:hypothetical protein HYT53_05995 [Candidatus Woesearchaeota archaeon]|nr:hypothetical protein [Candidatus Woesearchaeota archaeon]